MRQTLCFVTLMSHWRRHPANLATLFIGLAIATALWSGVQALNEQARRSYDRAAAVFGTGGTRSLVSTRGGLFSQDLATPGPVPSALLGIATGLLWAPCAGPILGLILTGAALNGASAWTSLLLLAYALGAATSTEICAEAICAPFQDWLSRNPGLPRHSARAVRCRTTAPSAPLRTVNAAHPATRAGFLPKIETIADQGRAT